MEEGFTITLPQPPGAGQLRFAIQKKDGRLFPKSAEYMHNMGFDLSPLMHPSQRLRIWHVSSKWGEACILVCSIKAILADVSNGDIDIGIVSSDAFDKWKNAQKEAFRRSAITNIHHLGPAGSNLMFGVRPDLMDRTTATWVQALQYCRDRKLPIVTCDEHKLKAFLKKRNINTKGLRFSQPDGSVEAHGVLMGTPLICDQVETGGTMQEHGYEPQLGDERDIVAKSTIMLIGARPRQSQRRRIFKQVWALATAET